MTTALTLFILSAVGLVVLFWHKIYEMHKGEPMLALGIREKGDTLVQEKLVDRKDAFIAGSKEMGKRIVKKTGQVSHDAVYSSLNMVNRGLTNTLEKMKGRRSRKNAANKAPASFFLQNVSEYKNGRENKENKPEDAAQSF